MRRTQRGLALLLALCLLLLSACGERRREAEENVIDDKYRNWYEVFVYSYYDSDGDRIGDLAGLAEKLDYIASLGMNGIWLMPIMPSPSYHKYDVTDYYGIDPAVRHAGGLLRPARQGAQPGHRRHNRPRREPHLQRAPLVPEREGGRELRVPRILQLVGRAARRLRRAGGSWYECRFVNTMPDLNLDSEAVRAEIERILRFWLEDVGVDGFRLDAVTSYYTGERERNIDFLSWLGETAPGHQPRLLHRGRGLDRPLRDRRLLRSGHRQLLPLPRRAERRLHRGDTRPRREGAGQELRQRHGPARAAAARRTPSRPPSSATTTRPAPRAVLGPDTAKQKMAAGLLAMMRGGTFVYYGDEIGMTGSKTDPDKRLGMLWTTLSETTHCPPARPRRTTPSPP